MAKVAATVVSALIILAIFMEGLTGCQTPGKKNCNEPCYKHCDCAEGKPHDFGAGEKQCTKCTYPLFKSIGYCK
nr:holocyclotoxin 13 [Ixodes holocyclus]